MTGIPAAAGACSTFLWSRHVLFTGARGAIAFPDTYSGAGSVLHSTHVSVSWLANHRLDGDSMDEVVVCPNGGLCNRLLNIACAVGELSDPSGEQGGHCSPLNVSWVHREACPAAFEDLFEAHPRLKFVDQATFSTYVRAGAKVINASVKLSRLKAQDPRRLQMLLTDLFRPLPGIQTEIDAFARSHDVAGCVGLHVRRTDHLSTAEGRGGVTSDDEFVAAIRERLALEPQQRFYLATDNAATQRWLTGLFPGPTICYWSKIGLQGEEAPAPTLGGVADASSCTGVDDDDINAGGCRDEQAPRSEKAKRPPPYRHTSMVHAVVDLWMLSRCKAIVGSNASSYTDFAQWMRGRPREG